MKIIQTSFCLSVLLILSLMTTYTHLLQAESLMMGRIQFPRALSKVPMIRVYSTGKKVPYKLCEVDNDTKQFTFNVPRFKNQTTFYLLIIQAFDFKLSTQKNIDERQNTIDYLKIAPNQPYKLYRLELVEISPEKKNSTVLQEKNHKTVRSDYRWMVKEQRVSPETGRIPDEAIIILYNPLYIATLQGGSAFELPTIVLKSNLLELAGSEDNLLDTSNALVLAALDSDTIHATIRQEIKHSHQRALVATAA